MGLESSVRTFPWLFDLDPPPGTWFSFYSFCLSTTIYSCQNPLLSILVYYLSEVELVKIYFLFLLWLLSFSYTYMSNIYVAIGSTAVTRAQHLKRMEFYGELCPVSINDLRVDPSWILGIWSERNLMVHTIIINLDLDYQVHRSQMQFTVVR